MPRHVSKAIRAHHGTSLIEVLVTLVIVAFGLLGLAGFISKSTTLTTDTSQRARAVSLVDDMTSRITANRANAADYVSAISTYSGTIAGGASVDCSSIASPTRAKTDVCEWNNLLYGTNDGGSGASALGYRGCISQVPGNNPASYEVIVAWGTASSGYPPANTCGQSVFGDTYRRTLRMQVRVACLTC
jgi:type IV pilus assembly protein PilV